MEEMDLDKGPGKCDARDRDSFIGYPEDAAL